MEREPNEPLVKALLALKPDHPLRQQVMAALTDPTAPVPEVHTALDALLCFSLFRKRERAVAFWLITHANWSDAQRATISETLSIAILRVLKARKPSRVTQRWLLRGMFVTLPMTLALVLDLCDQERGRPDLTLMEVIASVMVALVLSGGLTIIGAVITLPLSIWLDNQNLNELRPVVEALGDVGQSGSIVALAAATMDISLQKVAAFAMAGVVARMQPEDYGTLPQQTVPILCQAVTARALPQTVLMILQVLTVVGDGRAISTVVNLSKRATRADIREVAANLLPILQQRVLDSEAASLLLRASNAPPDPGHTLLRPAREQPDANPSQLLRMAPTQAENERQ